MVPLNSTRCVAPCLEVPSQTWIFGRCLCLYLSFLGLSLLISSRQMSGLDGSGDLSINFIKPPKLLAKMTVGKFPCSSIVWDRQPKTFFHPPTLWSRRRHTTLSLPSSVHFSKFVRTYSLNEPDSTPDDRRTGYQSNSSLPASTNW